MTKEDIATHINRIEGQIHGINKMIAAERDCLAVLQQIVAARASLASLGVSLLHDSMASCLKEKRSEELARIANQLFKLV